MLQIFSILIVYGLVFLSYFIKRHFRPWKSAFTNTSYFVGEKKEKQLDLETYR